MDDLISRSALLADYEKNGNCDGSGAIYEDTVNLINEQPAVDAVEVVHGRWISKECKPHLIYKCSECGDVWSYGAIIQMKYCPNCGAKMDGERKENE